MPDVWDPTQHQDPMRVLTQRVRGLPVGHALHLLDGTVIQSVPVKRGSNHVRQFLVSRAGTEEEGRNIPYPTASQAAVEALGKKKGARR